eukprot:CAMPEP_0171572380 /NCGR_PEP_ID=MMETSP0961-20121227/4105_1 /TAXON_ID=87120 /ORGANISM="Aurantiochytrium limacinum, Strain ATCCMYA-1381" /LENGTH=78 /DNA_ID=CAMNT_0012127249 /DNA_START=1172 /DNA_END=1408 /DNA_ORIENTATION=+
MRKKLRQASHKAVYEVGSSPEKLKSSVEASLKRSELIDLRVMVAFGKLVFKGVANSSQPAPVLGDGDDDASMCSSCWV